MCTPVETYLKKYSVPSAHYSLFRDAYSQFFFFVLYQYPGVHKIRARVPSGDWML